MCVSNIINWNIQAVFYWNIGHTFERVMIIINSWRNFAAFPLLEQSTLSGNHHKCCLDGQIRHSTYLISSLSLPSFCLRRNISISSAIESRNLECSSIEKVTGSVYVKANQLPNIGEKRQSILLRKSIDRRQTVFLTALTALEQGY